MLHLMRQTLADTAAASQDDRPAAGGDVDMVDQGAAAPDPQVPTGVSLSTARDAPASKRLAPWVPHHIWKRARLTHTARGAPGSRTARGPALSVPRMAWHASRLRSVPVGPQRCLRTSGWGEVD